MNTRMHFQRKAALVPQSTSFIQPSIFDASVTDQPVFGHDFSKIQIHAPGPETMQTKLAINQPGDIYEQEAERVAEKVTGMEAPEPSDAPPESRDAQSEANDLLTRNVASDRSVYEATSVPSLVDEVLGSGESQPLDDSTRTFMEPRFGHDFSRVRIHTNERAAESARSVNALAYTVGQNIVFGPGHYMPDTTTGKRLLAHELTHTLQQSSSAVLQRDAAPPTAPAPAASVDHLVEDLHSTLDNQGTTFNPENALKLLQEHTSQRDDIRKSFQGKYSRSLRGYIKEMLIVDRDRQVKCFALLNSSNTLGQDTAMALAVLSRYHDEEIFHILEHESLQGRQVMEKNYNATFGKQNDSDQGFLGTGSLKEDLKAASPMHIWVGQKSIAMLDHELTSAEHLYFDSVAIVGTHTDSVISRIQSEWSKGFANFAAFTLDWDNYVRNEKQWWKEKEPWTRMTLYQAMDDELSGESWKLVQAVLDGYEKFKKGLSASLNYMPTDQQTVDLLQKGAGHAISEDDIFKQEEIQLQVAETSLKAAEGIISDTTPQIYKAVETIQQIWQGRIQRVEAGLKVALDANDVTKIDLYKQKIPSYKEQSETKQKALKASYAAEGPKGEESLHVLLLLSGGLNMADEVYLAGRHGENNEAHVMSLLISYWAQGKMTELLKQSDKPKEDASHTVLRPVFEVPLQVLTASDQLPKILYIAKEGVDDATRGADLFSYELSKGNVDGDLKRGYDLLNTNGLNGTLRNQVIEKFVNATGTPIADGKYIDAFLNYAAKKYNNSNTVWLFKDLLQPTTDPNELLKRAQGRQAATGSSILTEGTAEDLETKESIQRLELIAKSHNASSEEMQGMIAMAGIDPTKGDALNQLATMEYKAFQERLDELRTTREKIVEIVTTIGQLIAETVVTIVTAGAALPMLMASLAATAANIVAHKLLLPPEEYEALTLRNIGQLAVVLASAGFGALGESVSKAIISIERAQQLGRAGAFVQSAIKEAHTKMGTLTVQAMFDQQAPTAEGIIATTVVILGSTTASGLHGSIAFQKVNEELPDIVAIRRVVIADAAKNLVDGISGQAADMERNGVGNLSGGEIAQKLAIDAGKNIVTGFAHTAANIKAQGVAAARQKKQDEAERDDDLEQTAHDPSKLQAGQQSVTAPGAAVKKGPQTVTVAQVNDEHSLSVVYHPDGEAMITLCSPVCGRLRYLLAAVQQKLRAEPATPNDVHQEVTDSLVEAVLLENKLRNMVPAPGSPEKAEIETLAGKVRGLLVKVGEKKLFGTNEGEDVRSALPPLTDKEIREEARSQSLLAPGKSPIESMLNNTTLPADLQTQIRQEISDALTLHAARRVLKPDGTPDDTRDGLWIIIENMSRVANTPFGTEKELRDNLRGYLSELRRLNRIAMSGAAANDVVAGALPGVPYSFANPRTGQTVTVKIDPVPDGDLLYLGNDGKIHLEEIKAMPATFVRKLEKNPNQLLNMEAWLKRQLPGEPERIATVTINSADRWGVLIGDPIQEANPDAPIQELIVSKIIVNIGGQSLTTDQLKKLYKAVVDMRAANLAGTDKDFLNTLPPLNTIPL